MPQLRVDQVERWDRIQAMSEEDLLAILGLQVDPFDEVGGVGLQVLPQDPEALHRAVEAGRAGLQDFLRDCGGDICAIWRRVRGDEVFTRKMLIALLATIAADYVGDGGSSQSLILCELLSRSCNFSLDTLCGS